MKDVVDSEWREESINAMEESVDSEWREESKVLRLSLMKDAGDSVLM